MQQVLLEQLSNSDIDLLKKIGSQEQVSVNSVLIEQKQPVDFFYIILDGQLTADISSDRDRALSRVYATLEENTDIEKEIVRFSKGEVIGEIALLKTKKSETTVKAVEKSVILKIPRQKLIEKLRPNPNFAAHFYRAIAILLSNRFDRLVKLYLHRARGQIKALEDVFLIFGELSDSDVDWMVETGHLQQISAGKTLIQADRRIEYLYILLDGKISVSVRERKGLLTNIFATLESNEETDFIPSRQIRQISKGETIGETALLDSKVSKYSFSATKDSLLLAIPLQKLAIELEKDPVAAARFYRVLSIIISKRLQGLINRLGFGRSSYHEGKKLSDDIRYEDEIDLEVMDNITLGGVRFSWMLDRLKVA